jgi:hypothetical protein
MHGFAHLRCFCHRSGTWTGRIAPLRRDGERLVPRISNINPWFHALFKSEYNPRTIEIIHSLAIPSFGARLVSPP